LNQEKQQPQQQPIPAVSNKPLQQTSNQDGIGSRAVILEKGQTSKELIEKEDQTSRTSKKHPPTASVLTIEKHGSASSHREKDNSTSTSTSIPTGLVARVEEWASWMEEIVKHRVCHVTAEGKEVYEFLVRWPSSHKSKNNKVDPIWYDEDCISQLAIDKYFATIRKKKEQNKPKPKPKKSSNTKRNKKKDDKHVDGLGSATMITRLAQASSTDTDDNVRLVLQQQHSGAMDDLLLEGDILSDIDLDADDDHFYHHDDHVVVVVAKDHCQTLPAKAIVTLEDSGQPSCESSPHSVSQSSAEKDTCQPLPAKTTIRTLEEENGQPSSESSPHSVSESSVEKDNCQILPAKTTTTLEECVHPSEASPHSVSGSSSDNEHDVAKTDANPISIVAPQGVVSLEVLQTTLLKVTLCPACLQNFSADPESKHCPCMSQGCGHSICANCVNRACNVSRQNDKEWWPCPVPDCLSPDRAFSTTRLPSANFALMSTIAGVSHLLMAGSSRTGDDNAT